MPVCVLGQDSCKTVKCRDTSGRLVSFKEPGTDKELFLKNLESLFSSSRGNFTCNNTVIVDDSPCKHIMNKPENVVLPDAWSNQGNGDKDTGEYIYESVERRVESGERRAVVGERKIDYSVVIFLEKEPLKPWKSGRLGSKFSLKLTKKTPKPWNMPSKIVK